MKAAIRGHTGAGRGRRRVRLLFTCAGRRVELIQAFQRAGAKLGLRTEIHTADADPYPAAACLADHNHRVPAADDQAYVPALLSIVQRARIDLLVPLIDSELLKLARAREDFSRRGCCALISSPGVVQTCWDKLTTFAFLSRCGIDTPATWTAAEVLARTRHRFPYFLKPRKGSASQGNFILRNKADLQALAPRVPDAIIQEYVPGIEHTLDVYTGLDGVPRCVVPRERVEVRGGEVTKAKTVKHAGIIATGLDVARALGDCRGLLTIQLMLTPRGRISVLEINPRFGGGVPLAIHAGADFPRWLLQEWLGQQPRIRLDHFRPGVLMMRYHQSFYRNV